MWGVSTLSSTDCAGTIIQTKLQSSVLYTPEDTNTNSSYLEKKKQHQKAAQHLSPQKDSLNTKGSPFKTDHPKVQS